MVRGLEKNIKVINIELSDTFDISKSCNREYRI
jgi:hypothetical protein